jgi:hypothetical protein
MKRSVVTSLMAASVALATIVPPIAARAGEVYNREQYQEHRIYQGVRNGTVGPREYEVLQNQEARLNARRVEDLENHDGRLTPAEYRNLNRAENRLSHEIYRDKHN